MFTSKYKICQLFGIPVYLSMTTICMLFFFVGMTGSIMMDLACMVMLLISIVAHELGHSLTARCFGCRTRDITLTVIGGCASLERIPHKAWQEFLTAAAGPLVSFAIGVAMFFAWLAPELSFDSLEVTFWGRPGFQSYNYIAGGDASSARSITVGVMTDPNDANTFTPIQKVSVEQVFPAQKGFVADDPEGTQCHTLRHLYRRHQAEPLPQPLHHTQCQGQ